jgi:hypothetical protein
MPPKETYQQIKERNERDIRRRTKDRISALKVQNKKESARTRISALMELNMKESARTRRNLEAERDVVVVETDEEDSEDERPFGNEGEEAYYMSNSSPTCVVCLRRQVYWTACVRLSCVLLFLFLLFCLNRMYHT